MLVERLARALKMIRMISPLNIIKTAQQIITVDGKVLYNDKRRRIDLKKPIRDLFEGTSMDIFYVMELCLSKEKTLERIRQLNEEEIIPIILYFRRGISR